MLDYIRNNKLGTLCLILALVMAFLGLPAQIVKIWQTKNVEGVSSLFFLFMLAQAVAWTFYGTREKDYAIWVPNIFVAISSFIVLLEWLAFR